MLFWRIAYNWTLTNSSWKKQFPTHYKLNLLPGRNQTWQSVYCHFKYNYPSLFSSNISHCPCWYLLKRLMFVSSNTSFIYPCIFSILFARLKQTAQMHAIKKTKKISSEMQHWISQITFQQTMQSLNSQNLFNFSCAHTKKTFSLFVWSVSYIYIYICILCV